MADSTVVAVSASMDEIDVELDVAATYIECAHDTDGYQISRISGNLVVGTYNVSVLNLGGGYNVLLTTDGSFATTPSPAEHTISELGVGWQVLIEWSGIGPYTVPAILGGRTFGLSADLQHQIEMTIADVVGNPINFTGNMRPLFDPSIITVHPPSGPNMPLDVLAFTAGVATVDIAVNGNVQGVPIAFSLSGDPLGTGTDTFLTTQTIYTYNSSAEGDMGLKEFKSFSLNAVENASDFTYEHQTRQGGFLSAVAVRLPAIPQQEDGGGGWEAVNALDVSVKITGKTALASTYDVSAKTAGAWNVITLSDGGTPANQLIEIGELIELKVVAIPTGGRKVRDMVSLDFAFDILSHKP
jgi:hypothetical protein